MAMSIWRADTLERYEREKLPKEGIENALWLAIIIPTDIGPAIKREKFHL